MTFLHVIAISLLVLAVVRSLQHRLRRTVNVWPNLPWKPPYAPDFESQDLQLPSGAAAFTVEAINARRTRAEAIRAVDNTEFIPDMYAYRCKVCSTIHVNWHDAFNCHKGFS